MPKMMEFLYFLGVLRCTNMYRLIILLGWLPFEVTHCYNYLLRILFFNHVSYFMLLDMHATLTIAFSVKGCFMSLW